MNLKGILSIATFPGLYRHVAQAKNGLIIESIVDGKRQLAYATSRISALEDISIYTNDGGDTKLSEVYKNLYNALDGKATPFTPKKASNEELTELFAKALPNWDTDRVYISDIKRAYTWYNILVETGYAAKSDEQEAAPAEEPASEAAASAAEEGEIKTKKRTRKKAAPKDGEAKAE